MVSGEAVLVAAIGTGLGLLAAWPGLLGIAAGLNADFDTDIGVRLPWPVMATVIGSCLAVALVASVLPARAAMTGTATTGTTDRE